MYRKAVLIGCWLCHLGILGLLAQDYPLIRALQGHEGKVHAIQFSPVGKWLASASSDGTVKVWDLKAGQERLTMGHQAPVHALAYRPDGRQLLSGGARGLIKTWNTHDGQLLARLEAHPAAVRAVAISPDGQHAWSLDEGHRLQRQALPLANKSQHLDLGQQVHALAISPDGRYLALGDWWGHVQVRDAATFEPLFEVEAHGLQVNALAFSPDSRWLASGGADKRIHLWDVEAGSLLKALEGHRLAVYDLAFSPDQRLLASGGRDRALKLWNLRQGVLAHQILHPQAVHAVDFSPNGKLVASGSRDGIVRVFLRPEARQALAQARSAPAGAPSPAALEARSEVDAHLPPFQGNNPQAVAVVIGNKQYRHASVPAVTYAWQDASTVRRYLIEVFGFQEENVLFLPDATQADFRGVFGSSEDPRGRLYNLLRKGESDVFVYYSGHGAVNVEDRAAYFVPVDCDPDLLGLQGYAAQTLYQNLAQLPCRSLTLVVDACFSGLSDGGPLIQEASPVFIKPRMPELSQANANVFLASQGHQLASWYAPKSHGLFTYAWLKGLQGAAEQNGDGLLTLAELRDYLQEEVAYLARRLKNRRQEPVVMGQDERIMLRY